jgi:hypothetical protein
MCSALLQRATEHNFEQTAHCALHTAHCTMYTVHCAQHTAHSTIDGASQRFTTHTPPRHTHRLPRSVRTRQPPSATWPHSSSTWNMHRMDGEEDHARVTRGHTHTGVSSDKETPLPPKAQPPSFKTTPLLLQSHKDARTLTHPPLPQSTRAHRHTTALIKQWKPTRPPPPSFPLHSPPPAAPGHCTAPTGCGWP